MIFVAINQTINSGLQGLNKVHIPAIALAIGATVKLILNVILISNPIINIYGAPISSIVCQIIAFSVSYTALRKSIKLNINFNKNILKPILSGIIMGILVYITNYILGLIINPKISTLISIMIGVLSYGLTLLKLNVLTKGDILMLPFGTKIYKVLEKIKLC